MRKHFLAILVALAAIAGIGSFLVTLIQFTEKPLSVNATFVAQIIGGILLVSVCGYFAWLVWQLYDKHKSLVADYAKLRLSLRQFFGKNEQLRKALHSDNLKGIFDGGEQYPVATLAADRILDKLRTGLICRLGHDRFYCEIVFDGVPDYDQIDKKVLFPRNYDAHIPSQQLNFERYYLRNGRSLARTCLTKKQIVFSKLEEVNAYHDIDNWPTMGDFVQSGILVLIYQDSSTIAVLQVTSPDKDAFSSEVKDIVECTADVFGTLFGVMCFVESLNSEWNTEKEHKNKATIDDNEGDKVRP